MDIIDLFYSIQFFWNTLIFLGKLCYFNLNITICKLFPLCKMYFSAFNFYPFYHLCSFRVSLLSIFVLYICLYTYIYIFSLVHWKRSLTPRGNTSHAQRYRFFTRPVVRTGLPWKIPLKRAFRDHNLW